VLNSTSVRLWLLCLFSRVEILILFICLSDDKYKDCSVVNKRQRKTSGKLRIDNSEKPTTLDPTGGTLGCSRRLSSSNNK